MPAGAASPRFVLLVLLAAIAGVSAAGACSSYGSAASQPPGADAGDGAVPAPPGPPGPPADGGTNDAAGGDDGCGPTLRVRDDFERAAVIPGGPWLDDGRAIPLLTIDTEAATGAGALFAHLPQGTASIVEPADTITVGVDAPPSGRLCVTFLAELTTAPASAAMPVGFTSIVDVTVSAADNSRTSISVNVDPAGTFVKLAAKRVDVDLTTSTYRRWTLRFDPATSVSELLVDGKIAASGVVTAGPAPLRYGVSLGVPYTGSTTSGEIRFHADDFAVE